MVSLDIYNYLLGTGLVRHHKDKHYPVLLCVSHIDEMNGIVAMETGITFGAAVTLTAVEDYIQDIIDQHVNGRRSKFHIFFAESNLRKTNFHFIAIFNSPLLDIDQIISRPGQFNPIYCNIT